MDNFFIILGTLLVLCVAGIVGLKMMRKNRRVDDPVIRMPDGKLGYAFTDDKVYGGVVVANNGSETFIRTTDDALYVLRRGPLPVGKEVVIAVRNRPSPMDEYLKPMVLPKFVISKDGDIMATLLCRLNKDIVLCSVTTQSDDWCNSIKKDFFLVEATVEEQAKYSSKTVEEDNEPIPFVDYFEYEKQEPCIIPVRRIEGEKIKITACLQKSSKTKLKGL